jgi:glycosyltransferase involved in cell wall biosynthesis
MKILVIAYYFAPYNTIGAVRMTKMVKYLERLGYDVRVISANNQLLPKTLSVESKEENIIRTNYLTLQKYFQSFLGGRETIQNKGFQLEKRAWLFRKIAHLYKSLFHFPDGQIGWYPFAIREGKRLTKTWKPDVIVSSGGPFTGFLVAKKLAKINEVPWIADLRDLWVDNANYAYPRLRKKIEQRLERSVLSSVAAIITVSAPFAEKLKRKYNSQVKVITNGFDEEDYDKIIKSNHYEHSKKLSILYTGMVYDKYQDITPLFTVLANNSTLAEQVEVEFYGRGLDVVEKMKDKFRLNHCVKIHEPVGHKEIMKIQCNSDILLLLIWNDPNEKGNIPGKIFEYFGARRPILAIGPIDTVASECIKKNNRGIVCYSEEEIKNQLRGWIAEKQKGYIDSLPALTKEIYTRKGQTKQLQSLLEEVKSGCNG